MTESELTGRPAAILVLFATLATIGFNFLSATGRINCVTPEQISNRYPTPITPDGYAFTIWSLIYIGLIAFSIYQILPANIGKFKMVRMLYFLSCGLNCVWIYLWHNDLIVACFLVILALAGTLFFINSRLPKAESTGEYWVAKATFGIYFGWVSAAAIVNFAVMLVYLGTSVSDAQWTALAVFMITLAAGLGLYFRAKMSDCLYPLAIAWALTAIAVKQSGNTAVVVACAVGVVVNLIASLTFVVNLPSHSTANHTSK